MLPAAKLLIFKVGSKSQPTSAMAHAMPHSALAFL